MRSARVLSLLLLVGSAACAPRRPAGPWLLVHPPGVQDPSAPRGIRLLPQAPISEWQPQGAFRTQEECAQAKKARIDKTIDRARASDGEKEAPFHPDVRRSVNAQCVWAEEARPGKEPEVR